jgi:hypothetical protein
MNTITSDIPREIRHQLADTLEDIGQAMGLLRETCDDLDGGNPEGGAMCASDAQEILGNLEATYSSLSARLANFVAASNGEPTLDL